MNPAQVLTAAIWLTSEVTGFVRNHIGEGDGVSHLVRRAAQPDRAARGAPAGHSRRAGQLRSLSPSALWLIHRLLTALSSSALEN